ncbi:hypothetical protein [Peribacillus kribbensis]|uniref:hypothetical protein n=1 Tax=Peribacillus kribbensis TaxID=356658 RepID=UPI00040ACA1F|nr:hypothetical protein [Peribacillus kribbensis]
MPFFFFYKRGEKMPRGDELNALPMPHTAPGAGKDLSEFDREDKSGITREETPRPAQVKNRS